MLHSHYRDLGPIELPPWRGRLKYMISFNTGSYLMEPGFEDYSSVARALCEAARHQGPAHMTVDEKIVPAGMSQRRPGPHVDGRFTQGYWHHPPPSEPRWAHYCNRVPVDRMAVIVAASVPGCRVFEGEFEGSPREDGDLEHIRRQLPVGELLPAGKGFLLSPDCVHESVLFHEPTKRSFLRIALET